ncbi:M28 family peptidase [Nocardioides sp. MAH-18]|uniref:M28 family peptidase n=1 Tax=Nocardioides agri TaxID=2682843 RepID=A0A6L6XQZ4_9ACTN|nr:MULTISPECIES: M28 family peptidase [unclassified Nocardioides]MBA2954937.1 M28 family peptidase [Nocardioides sp. CGMCC 1.13656]MVQ49791.1 M28 family peptidase [Nocardioides sp. MAH-18]
MRRALVASLVVLTAGCTDAPTADPPDPAAPVTTASATPTTAADPEPVPAREFEAARALRTVRHLAGRIGPRLATGPAFRGAAAYVGDALADLGYVVRRQPVAVPAGDSWGVPVKAGRSSNVIATPADFDPAAPWLLVGAHLDTVAVAPGAEDNASGVAVLLELARVLGGRGQVVLVAFGAEEPRGPGDLHHFGSKRYVAALDDDEGVHLRGMVSLDRVGVGAVVPLSSVAGTPSALRDRLARVAERAGVPHRVETDAASDHESFADAGFLAARIGSTPYAGYHSAADVPAVVDPRQLHRVGELLSAWLRAS